MDILRSILWDFALIPVDPVAEPADFDQKVRQPGIAFLGKTPQPNSGTWGDHDYWRRAICDLLFAYRSICSYSGSWTKKFDINSGSTILDSSVDHFIPKSTSHAQAYEWSNFRLSRARMNNYKDNFNDVLDPFLLPDRWFTLNFRTFLITPNDALCDSNKIRVRTTIDRLKLNKDDDYVNEREGVIREYCLGTYTLAMLEKFWPFIANEMKVQNFDSIFLPSMRPYFKANP